MFYLNFWSITLLEFPSKYYVSSFPNGARKLSFFSVAFVLATCGYGWSDRNSNHSDFFCLCSHLSAQGPWFPVSSNILLSISGSPRRQSHLCSQSNPIHPASAVSCWALRAPDRFLCCTSGHHLWHGECWGTSATSPDPAGSMGTTFTLNAVSGGYLLSTNFSHCNEAVKPWNFPSCEVFSFKLGKHLPLWHTLSKWALRADAAYGVLKNK